MKRLDDLLQNVLTAITGPLTHAERVLNQAKDTGKATFDQGDISTGGDDSTYDEIPNQIATLQAISNLLEVAYQAAYTSEHDDESVTDLKEKVTKALQTGFVLFDDDSDHETVLFRLLNTFDIDPDQIS